MLLDNYLTFCIVMRLTEGISAFNLEFSPCDVQERLLFTHLTNEDLRELRKLGQKNKKLPENSDFLFDYF